MITRQLNEVHIMNHLQLGDHQVVDISNNTNQTSWTLY